MFTEFTKKFKDYWEVVGREGLALTEIYKMHKDKLKIPLYIASFKERIKEMDIKDDIAIIPMFSQGLKPDVHHHVLLQNPKMLEDWYDHATRFHNVKQRTGVLQSLASGSRSGSKPYTK